MSERRGAMPHFGAIIPWGDFHALAANFDFDFG